MCTGTHPFMAPNREALAGNGLPVANALDKTVANNNMLVLAHDSVGHSLGIAGCLGDGVGCQCGHSSWRLLRVAGPLLLLARRALWHEVEAAPPVVLDACSWGPRKCVQQSCQLCAFHVQFWTRAAS